MFVQLTSCKRTLPVEIRLIAIAVAAGLAAGAFYLNESVDLATAVGIVVCFSAAVGGWLGLRLYLMTARFFISWIDAIGNRIASLESRLTQAGLLNRDEDYGKPRRSLAMHIVLISAYATPVCFVTVTTNAIATALSTQLGPHFAVAHLAITLSGAGALVLVVAVQSLYLWRLQQQVASFKQLLKRIDSVSPVTLKVQVLNRNIDRTERLVRLLTGISKPIAEQAAA